MEVNSSNGVRVYPDVYAEPYYELVTWTKTKECSNDLALHDLRYNGHIYAGYHQSGIGVFFDKESALSKMQELVEADGDTGFHRYFYLREKPQAVMMGEYDYIKEYTYDNGHLVDESVVCNYDVKNNPFMGRTEEQIQHKVGDIVLVLTDYESYWGIVSHIPPKYDGQPQGTLLDDTYRVCTSANNQWKIMAHRVLKPHDVPDYVEKLLRAEMNNVQNGID